MTSSPLCARPPGTPAFTSTNDLGPSGATSASDTAEVVGTWHWVAIYKGDANFTSVSSGCQDAKVTITAAGAIPAGAAASSVTPPATVVPGLPNTGALSPGSGPSARDPLTPALLLLTALGVVGVWITWLWLRRPDRARA
jgi:hypothetical protein